MNLAKRPAPFILLVMCCQWICLGGRVRTSVDMLLVERCSYAKHLWLIRQMQQL